MLAFDYRLLPGLVALEQGFISDTDLISAFRQWRCSPAGSLGQILADQGKLAPERIERLNALLENSSVESQAASALDSPPTTSWKPGTTSVSGTNTTIPLPSPSTKSGNRHPPPAYQGPLGARYRTVRLHAQGGLGQVFVAEDLELRRQVALKEIQPRCARDEDSRRRFLLEAEITGNLEHPGIVPVYGLGVYADGSPFYAMRLIQGETLSKAIERFHKQAPLDYSAWEFRQLVRRFVDICNAVAFAHSRGIIHRDLKPQNVMLGPFGETLVMDWGLARRMSAAGDAGDAPLVSVARWLASPDGSATRTGDAVGTPAFMSPEQAQGRVREIGPAADVYGVGAMLYALLVGRPPYRGDSTQILQAAGEGNFSHPRQLQPQVPRALSAICLKAMAREPDQRYASALDMAADIERWLADEPVLAYPEPWFDRAHRWTRRHRLAVAVASVLLLATSVALAVGYVLVSKERDVARAERGKAVFANEQAQQSAAATRQVVEQFLIRVGDDRWSQVPGFEDMRLQMVNLAVGHYRAMLARQPDEPALRADAAMAFRRCANLYRMVGRFEEAQGLYESAVRLLRQVTAAIPHEGAQQRRLCETLNDQALLAARVRGPAAAEAPLREALQMARVLRARQQSRDVLLTEARLQGDLADVLCDLGHYQEAVALGESCAATLAHEAESSSNPAIRMQAAFAAVNLVRLLREAGRDEADSLLGLALNRAQTYLDRDPLDPNLRYVLARAKHERGLMLLRDPAKAGETQQELEQVLTMLERLVEEFPRTVSFRRKLAEVRIDRGKLALRRHELSEAAAEAARAITTLTQLHTEAGGAVVFHPFLAAAYRLAGEVDLQQGRLEEARAKLQTAISHFEQARKANPSNVRLAEEDRRVETLLRGQLE